MKLKPNGFYHGVITTFILTADSHVNKVQDEGVDNEWCLRCPPL